jgi:hypothetical protein
MREALARRRRAGHAFDAAWDISWREIRWSADTGWRRASKAALTETREVWRAAYAREPLPVRNPDSLSLLAATVLDDGFPLLPVG